MFETGDIFYTGNIFIEITKIVFVTKWCSSVYFKILNSGIISSWEFDMGSKELEEGIKKGVILWECNSKVIG